MGTRKKVKTAPPAQGSLFEEDFLRRTLGDLVRVPDVALSELVANAWDAGAANVEITIPGEHSSVLSIQDDGCGLDEESFKTRWMTLAYDRQRHQGSSAEFPPGRSDWRRRAYGRNGQGRHGLLCFADSYEVETRRDGRARVFRVSVSHGKEPFVSSKRRDFKKRGHGTRVSVVVERHLPDPDRIRHVLASRFLHDPQFSIRVNGSSIPLAEHPGLITERELTIDGAYLKLFCLEGEPGRSIHQSGVAIWVGGRLVGEPGWVLNGTQIIDGRTRPGRRLTFVVKTDDLFDEVLPDWTDFRRTDFMSLVFDGVVEAVRDVLRELLSSRVEETRDEVIGGQRMALGELSPGEAAEVTDIVDAVTHAHPLLAPSAISMVVDGVIEAKRNRSPAVLMQRIFDLPPEDIEGLNRLLNEWTVRDALTVLDEIGRRIKTVEALEKVMGDPKVDELRVIHPLVTQARWLFGPEFESPLYASNVTLRNAVKKVFGQEIEANAFDNPRNRPDLVALKDSTLSAVACEDVDMTTGLVRLRTVLVIEVKKAGATIGRKEVNQAEGYVEDLRTCGLLDGDPHVASFVVGHARSSKLTPVRRVGDPEVGRIEAVTFGQLVRTANVRLFRIREQVEERYPERGATLAQRLRETDELLLPLPRE